MVPKITTFLCAHTKNQHSEAKLYTVNWLWDTHFCPDRHLGKKHRSKRTKWGGEGGKHINAHQCHAHFAKNRERFVSCAWSSIQVLIKRRIRQQSHPIICGTHAMSKSTRGRGGYFRENVNVPTRGITFNPFWVQGYSSRTQISKITSHFFSKENGSKTFSQLPPLIKISICKLNTLFDNPLHM